MTQVVCGRLGYWILDAGYWTQGAGLDAGCWMLDIGHGILLITNVRDGFKPSRVNGVRKAHRGLEQANKIATLQQHTLKAPRARELQRSKRGAQGDCDETALKPKKRTHDHTGIQNNWNWAVIEDPHTLMA